jgi:hypothetical protein
MHQEGFPQRSGSLIHAVSRRVTVRRRLAILTLTLVLGATAAIGLATVTAPPAAASNSCYARAYASTDASWRVSGYGIFYCNFQFNKVSAVTDIQKYNPVTGTWSMVKRWHDDYAIYPATSWRLDIGTYQANGPGQSFRVYSWGAVCPYIPGGPTPYPGTGCYQWWFSGLYAYSQTVKTY